MRKQSTMTYQTGENINHLKNYHHDMTKKKHLAMSLKYFYYILRYSYTYCFVDEIIFHEWYKKLRINSH